MLALYSSVLRLAFSSVAWPTGVGVVTGLLAGSGLAYFAIDRLLRAHGAAPRRGAMRRFAAACAVVWGLVLPIGLGAAGLIWGAGFGLATVVEGPVSATVRETIHSTVGAANAAGAGLLRHLPLAKRLSERDLLALTEAAPAWIATTLDEPRLASAWQRATGTALPPGLASLLREVILGSNGERPAWLGQAIERLRTRTRGAAAGWPTVQEAIEATVGAPAFDDIGAAIRKTSRRDAALIAVAALAAAGGLAGALGVAWRRTAASAPASTGRAAHG